MSKTDNVDPPSYDIATDNGPKQMLIPHEHIHQMPAPSNYAAVNNNGATTVYRYYNPATQQHVTSLLPPDHPEMICLQNGHLSHTKFGLLGIIAAVLWFPLGLGCLLLDKETVCERCHRRMRDL